MEKGDLIKGVIFLLMVFLVIFILLYVFVFRVEIGSSIDGRDNYKNNSMNLINENCVDADKDRILDYNSNYCRLGKDVCIVSVTSLSETEKKAKLPTSTNINIEINDSIDYTNYPNFTIRKEPYAYVTFKNPISIIGVNEIGCFEKINLDNSITISHARVSIFSLINDFNSSAIIRFNNITFNEPEVYKGNSKCSENECKITGYYKDVDILLVEVAGFPGDYTIKEKTNNSLTTTNVSNNKTGVLSSPEDDSPGGEVKGEYDYVILIIEIIVFGIFVVLVILFFVLYIRAKRNKSISGGIVEKTTQFINQIEEGYKNKNQDIVQLSYGEIQKLFELAQPTEKQIITDMMNDLVRRLSYRQ